MFLKSKMDQFGVSDNIIDQGVFSTMSVEQPTRNSNSISFFDIHSQTQKGTFWGAYAKQGRISNKYLYERSIERIESLPNKITSRGQTFELFPFDNFNTTNTKKFYGSHICNCPRYYPYSVEMLRWFDYIQGGGINYIAK